MTRTWGLVAVVGLAAGLCCGTALLAEPKTDAKTDADKTSKVDDNTFVMKASQAGLAEVNLSNLALRLSKNADVQKFAQRMVTDHTKANMELNQLANRLKITPASDMDQKHQELFTKLGRESGADFDRDYAKAMVDDHHEAVDLFTEESEHGQNADLKGWAGKTLPTLKEHLKMAEDLAKKSKGSGGSSGSPK